MLFKPAPPRCPLCGIPHASCGPQGTGTPVDVPRRATTPQAGVLSPYDVVVGGITTTLLLTLTDAIARGLVEPLPPEGT